MMNLPTWNWFLVISTLTILSLFVGVLLARRSLMSAASTMVIALTGVVAFAWLQRNPSVLVYLGPVELIKHIEGVAAAPFFMLFVGAAWGASEQTRQKRIAFAAGMLGLIFFVQGSLWMLLPSPAMILNDDRTGGEVRQTTNFTCAPAAAATALNLVNVVTSEAEMAELTQTRPGVGASLIRTLAGMNKRLAGSGYEAMIVNVDYDTLIASPYPFLTTMRDDQTRMFSSHMVAVDVVNHRSVRILDPEMGRTSMTRGMFDQLRQRDVIMISRTSAQIATRTRISRTDQRLSL